MVETTTQTPNPQTQEIPKDPRVVRLLNAWDRTLGEAMLLASFVDTFPGILYVTLKDTDEVLFASANYEERLNGEAWFPLGSIKSQAFVVHWMIPCPAESFPGVWFVTDKDGKVISHSRNYKNLLVGRWVCMGKTPRPNGETLHWMVKIGLD